PALNVEFSDRELEDLRQIAKERGTSMKALVREAAAADIARHRALQEGAEAFRRFFASHAEEFAAAFPDDEPRTEDEGRAAWPMATVLHIDVPWVVQRHVGVLPDQPVIDEFYVLVVVVARHHLHPPRVAAY